MGKPCSVRAGHEGERARMYVRVTLGSGVKGK